MLDDLYKFWDTKVYHDWIAGQNITNHDDEKELRFQAMMKHYCGHSYSGPLEHKDNIASDDFRRMFCPNMLLKDRLKYDINLL